VYHTKRAITPEEAAELQRLLDELPKTAEAVVEALKLATESPTGAAHERYRKLAARINEITDRINKIRG
jgi:hypothetical protein